MLYEPLHQFVENEILHTNEKMFGMKDKFQYKKTINGSLVISNIPENISKYYPNNYYSFNQNLKLNFFSSYLKKIRNSYSFERKNLLGRVLHSLRPEKVLDSIQAINVFNKDSKILDVGCGDGRLLSNLYNLGYKNLLGIDPFLKEESNNYFPLLKKSIFDIEEKFDVIILYHVFEHIDQPERALVQLKKLLNKRGTLIIAIPIADSYAFEKYRENWVQLDAPRHFYLYSSNEIVRLANYFGLKLFSKKYNSDEFQFLGSEQYQKGISLFDEKSYLTGLKNSIFNKKQINLYKKQSEILNKEFKGDQAVFFFKNED